MTVAGVVIKKSGATFLSSIGTAGTRKGDEIDADAMAEAMSGLESCRTMGMSPFIILVDLCRVVERLWWHLPRGTEQPKDPGVGAVWRIVSLSHESWWIQLPATYNSLLWSGWRM